MTKGSLQATQPLDDESEGASPPKLRREDEPVSERSEVSSEEKTPVESPAKVSRVLLGDFSCFFQFQFHYFLEKHQNGMCQAPVPTPAKAPSFKPSEILDDITDDEEYEEEL